jgi:hypothetical protein
MIWDAELATTQVTLLFGSSLTARTQQLSGQRSLLQKCMTEGVFNNPASILLETLITN